MTWSELTRSHEVRRSDDQRELVERCGKGQSRTCIDPALLVSSTEVLDEVRSTDHDAGRSVPFAAPHRAKSGLEAPVVGLDSVVGVLGGVMKCIRHE
jgi:hypothetical protein